ncbi:MAG: response regulator transcription factor [Propionibacteriaceae bacterium]|nr:response regulator transcription factor [Propionibacteriaceae bacterium]
MAHRVLIVDDEPQIRTVLRAYLEADGFEVNEVGTGADTLRELTRPGGRPIDVVLLDIGLPDLGGLDVLQKIRAASEVYVILVTARSEEVDKLIGLSVGADDYITKPFSPREVVARVKAVLRRNARAEVKGAPTDGDALVFEGLVIDRERREITTGAGPVTLSALEFDLLLALASAPGRVFSRAQLLEDVWGYDFYGDERVVDVHIRGMRAALGDDAANPQIIGTVRGVGYKFLKKAAS